MHSQSTFELLTNSETTDRRIWQGALTRLFQTCRTLMESMNADVQAGLLPETFCARSNVFDHVEFGNLGDDLRSLTDHYPLALESPFEGVATISGGIWQASDFCEANADDALLKLCFLAGTVDLPMHSHNYSDRVILVAEGTGVFESQSSAQDGQEVVSTELKLGDALVFARGTVHTFKVPSTNLVLLSYHSPFIPLADPRQYTVV